MSKVFEKKSDPKKMSKGGFVKESKQTKKRCNCKCFPGPVPIDPFCNYKEQVYQSEDAIWSVPRLIELSRDLPVYKIPIQFLDIYYTMSDICLREFVSHMKSVMNADLQFPIILNQDGEVMDGRHRLMKAIYLGESTIKAVRFLKDPPPCRYEEKE